MNQTQHSAFAGRLITALVLAGLGSATFAGGPLYTYDYENRIPYAWHMATWPNGRVPVYTDMGDLGPLTNARANELVGFAANQWSKVSTSAFRTVVAGDFASIGLGDIDANSVTSVLDDWNGGGMFVIYDDDGSIMENFFGLPPTGVLGITNIDYVERDTPEILEAWMVLSGPGIHPNDPNGVGFQGVVTHEMGHAINLAHSQSNGAVWNGVLADSPQPAGCPSPWSWQLDAAGAPSQVETMYPISTPEPRDSGEYMGTVDRIDDRSALSDIYPSAAYPGNMGTIRGEVRDASGTPVTGVNVIARNVADPFNDVNASITGKVSKGQAGPDGSFVLNGLTSGARYVIYLDQLEVGAFSVPPLVVLPGPEEYFSGASENGEMASDDRCGWVTLQVQKGSPVTANVTFNKYAGAPTFKSAPYLGYPTDITPDGSMIVGKWGGGVFQWDLNADTFVDIGGYPGGPASITDDGSKIVSAVTDTDGSVKAGIYENGAWTALPPVPGTTPCTQDLSPTTYDIPIDISGDGSTVVGQSYGDGCYRGAIRAYKWTEAGGSVTLPKFSSLNMMSRATGVSYDGSVIVGFDETTSGQWRGASWKSGAVKLMTRNGQSVNSATDVSRDGQYAVGQSSAASSNNGWRYSTTSSTVELLGLLPSFTNSVTLAISDDHGVVTGYTTSSLTGATAPTIWTPGLHWSDFNSFLLAQGVYLGDIYPYAPGSMSADARVITGVFASRYGDVGFVLKTPTSIVCHAPAGSPTQIQTTIVSFPHGLDAALASGDTLGPCACNMNAPTGVPALTVDKPAAGIAHLDWSAIGTATGYDLARGSLEVLRSSHGDFRAAMTDCLENDVTGTSRDDADTPAAGDGSWYLVRAASCGGSATFDSGAPSQLGSRDAGLQSSLSACP